MFFTLILYTGCKNPFAPAFDESVDQNSSTLSDQKTIEGVFQNFQYAYAFKDTTIYGRLLDNDFIFTYRDYEGGFDVSWGREEEMRTTYGLFRNSQRLDLIWNNILASSQDSLTFQVVRSFNLTITFNPTDIIRLDGKVNLTLRKGSDSTWRMIRWIDETNF